MVLADFLTETRRKWLQVFSPSAALASPAPSALSPLATRDVVHPRNLKSLADHILSPTDHWWSADHWLGTSALKHRRDAFKLFKRNKNRKSARNRVSPALVRSPSYSGTVDATPEIDLQRFCPCRTSLPPSRVNETFENINESYHSSYDSYGSQNGSLQSNNSQSSRWDSAYGSSRGSPHRTVCYAAVTYCSALDSEDSSSIHTEYTLLDVDPAAEDEHAQNVLNESREIVIGAALAEQTAAVL